MRATSLTPLERTLTSVGHQEPDTVPIFLGLTIHGARELGMSIQDYFADPRKVADGQLLMRDKFGHDNLMGFNHAAGELEAWGGSVRYFDDGPPNGGPPIITTPQQILELETARVENSPSLMATLELQRLLKAEVGNEVPIIAAVLSPFSLPVMQMGFEAYLNLMAESPQEFERLMQINEEFCVAWANAQLQAGATVIVYYDPVSSPTVIPPRTYLETGHKIAKRTLPRIEGATVTHFANGRSLAIAEDVARTGTAVISACSDEDLAELKQRCRGKLSIIGPLNDIGMCSWTPQAAETKVKKVIAQGGPGGGLIISNAHGEIPFQVQDEVLHAVVGAGRKWGRYPQDWIQTHD